MVVILVESLGQNTEERGPHHLPWLAGSKQKTVYYQTKKKKKSEAAVLIILNAI